MIRPLLFALALLVAAVILAFGALFLADPRSLRPAIHAALIGDDPATAATALGDL